MTIALKDLNVWQEYTDWNQALAKHCLLEGINEQVCLSISPSILSAAWAQQRSQSLPVGLSEAIFTNVVSTLYCSIVPSCGLRAFTVIGSDGLPQSIAFLGLSVLAAYKMRRDEEHAPNAYYSRFSQLLGCGHEDGYPRGFDPSEFKYLWAHLRRWLKEQKGISLAHPARSRGAYHIVGIPYSHVPLRQMDLQKLPSFFSTYSYHPGRVTSKHKLERDFLRWAASSRLTRAGLAALSDERCSAVMLQVAQELEAWDGATEGVEAGSAVVELHLDFIRHRPLFSYFPRRPRTFPELFEAGDYTFESCEEGWYDPVAVRYEDGKILEQGFTWTTAFKSRTLSLRWNASRAIALVPIPFQSGFVSRPRFLLNIRGAALCRLELESEAITYLKAITNRQCVPERGLDIPSGWILFRDVLPLRCIDSIPSELTSLDVETETNVFPVGGLRVNRHQWIHGAPPSIFVSGEMHGSLPTINGEAVEVGSGGQLLDGGRLSKLGNYIIKVGRETLRIEIIEPHVPVSDDPSDDNKCFRGPLVSLPSGSWSLIGGEHTEVMHIKDCHARGIITRAPFKAVWAINRSSAAGPKVVCLEVPSPLPARMYAPITQNHVAEQWAAVVLSPNTTTPRLGHIGAASYSQVLHAWRSYVAAAYGIVRSLRMARRRLA